MITTEQRNHIVALKQSGKTNAEIVHYFQTNFRIKVNRSTIQRTMARYRTTGNVQDRARSGRHVICSPREQRVLRRLALENRRASLSVLAGQASKIIGKSLSKETARRILSSFGLSRRIAKRRPALTNAHKRDRLAYAKAHKGWCLAPWTRVLFSDEKIFRVSSNRRGEFVTRTAEEKFHPACIVPTQKYGAQVHVWGAIGWRGPLPLIRIRGTLNAHEYQGQVLAGLPGVAMSVAGSGRLYGPQTWMLQQDNAPAHRALSTQQFLRDHRIRVLAWPPNSPDLNPIENLWGFVTRLLPRTPVHSADELFERVNAAWARIPYSLVRALFRSVPRRIQEVIQRKGNPTHY